MHSARRALIIDYLIWHLVSSAIQLIPFVWTLGIIGTSIVTAIEFSKPSFAIATLSIPSAIIIAGLVSGYLNDRFATSVCRDLTEQMRCVMRRRAERLHARQMRPTPTEPIHEALEATPNKAKPCDPTKFASKKHAASDAGSTSYVSGGSKCRCYHCTSKSSSTKCFYRNDSQPRKRNDGEPKTRNDKKARKRNDHEHRKRTVAEPRKPIITVGCFNDGRYPNMSNDRFLSFIELNNLPPPAKKSGNGPRHTGYSQPKAAHADLQPRVPQSVQPIQPRTTPIRLSSSPRQKVMRPTEISIKARKLEAKIRAAELALCRNDTPMDVDVDILTWEY